MRRAGAKRIVNISSIGGRIAVPHLVPYCASKASSENNELPGGEIGSLRRA
jgi:NAD(P)-dependent dehydrogenase (short-subunit alcohol dehydrogenase family)